MLVFQRKAGEKVMIGNDITVTFLDFRRGKAKIGFDAPKEVAIHREEVYNEIHKPKEQDQQKVEIK